MLPKQIASCAITHFTHVYHVACFVVDQTEQLALLATHPPDHLNNVTGVQK